MDVKIAALSDMHWKLPHPGDIPVCDILLIAGDVGHTDRLERWLEDVNERTGVTIGIAGNHDFNEEMPMLEMIPDWVYLQDETYEHESGLKIYGTPWTPPFRTWAFMAPEDELEIIWASIPDDTDILITHCPMYGVADKVKFPDRGEDPHAGSVALRSRIHELPNLKLHVFGHIHENGTQSGQYLGRETVWANVSMLNNDYTVHPGWKPFTMEIECES